MRIFSQIQPIYFVPILFVLSMSVFSEETSTSPSASISKLLDVAVQHGLPDVLGATTYAGDIIIANPITGEVTSGAETPVAMGLPSPTRESSAIGLQNGVRLRGQRYRGLARHLRDGRWLMGEVEVVTPTPETRIILDQAERLPGYPIKLPGAVVDNQGMPMALEMYSAIRHLVGSEREIIDQLFIAASAGGVSGETFTNPTPMLYHLRSGVELPRYVLPLFDVYARMLPLGQILHSNPSLVIDEVDNTDTVLLPDATKIDDGKFIATALADGRLVWPPPRPPLEVVRALLGDWFRYQSHLPGPQVEAALVALGCRAEDPSPIVPHAPPIAATADASVGERLKHWQPVPLHRAQEDTSAPTAAPGPTQDDEVGDAHSAPTVVPPLFSFRDFDELVIKLDDQQPGSWVAGETIRPVSDGALRALAEVLEFDPRHLVGLPVNGPWDLRQRQAAAQALRAWWQQGQGRPLAEMVADAAEKLPTQQAVLLLLRVPTSMRLALLNRLVPQWSLKPPVLGALPTAAVARLLALMRLHPQGNATVNHWDLTAQPPLLVALWHSDGGKTTALDSFWNRMVTQRAVAPTVVHPQDSQLIRKLLVPIAGTPTPSRIARLADFLRSPADQPFVQQLMVALMIRSTWTDGCDALLPSATETPGAPPRVALGAPSALYWALWVQLLGDQRPLPTGILSAIKITSEGQLSIEHPGGMYSDSLEVKYQSESLEKMEFKRPLTEKSLVLATDLRICDLMVWALLQQERQYLFDGDAAMKEYATFDLTQPQAKREELLTRFRKVFSSRAMLHVLPPLAQAVVRNDVAP